MPEKSCLFFPLSIGLAHIGRCFTVARVLVDRGWKTFCASASSLPQACFTDAPWEWLPIDDYAYDEVVQHGDRVFSRQDRLEALVAAECALIGRLRPSVIVGDTRCTLGITSRIVRIPLVSLFNANLTLEFGDRSATERSESLRRARILAEPYNAICSSLNIEHRFAHFYETLFGDCNCICDAPECVTAATPVPESTYVGPLVYEWEGEAAMPFPDAPSLLYVTAGGTGERGIFTTILRLLSSGTLPVVASGTAYIGDENPSLPQCTVRPFIRSRDVLPRTALAVTHGGNSTMYQCLSFGIPVVAVSTNADQYDHGRCVEAMGVGKHCDGRSFSHAQFLSAVEAVRCDPMYRRRAQELSVVLRQYNGPQTAAECIAAIGDAP